MWGGRQRPLSLSRHSKPQGTPDEGGSGSVAELSPPSHRLSYNLIIVTRAQRIRTALQFARRVYSCPVKISFHWKAWGNCTHSPYVQLG